MQDQSFDDLAKAMASGGLSRREALGRIGAVFGSALLLYLTPWRAEAVKCQGNKTECGNNCCDRKTQTCCQQISCCDAATQKCCSGGKCCNKSDECCGNGCCTEGTTCCVRGADTLCCSGIALELCLDLTNPITGEELIGLGCLAV